MFYGTGASANAAKIATDFSASAKPLASLSAGHVEVLLGTGSTVVPAGLASTSLPVAVRVRLVGRQPTTERPAARSRSPPTPGSEYPGILRYSVL